MGHDRGGSDCVSSSVRALPDKFSLGSRSTDDETDDTDHEDITEMDQIIIQKLSKREYHLPGNTYRQDFSQFLCNNHPLLGFCLSHDLHPLTVRDRVFCLVGSAAFGLAATCSIFFLFYMHHTMSVDVAGGHVEVRDWMVAGCAAALNSWFDLAVWYLQVCPCFRPGAPYGLDRRCGGRCWIWLGRNLAGIVVLVAAFLALAATMLHSWLTEENGQMGEESFSFLRSWLMELALSLVIVNPIMSFILFSGVLGCYRLPFLGGRPWQIRAEKEDESKVKSNEGEERGVAEGGQQREIGAYIPPVGQNERVEEGMAEEGQEQETDVYIPHTSGGWI